MAACGPTHPTEVAREVVFGRKVTWIAVKGGPLDKSTASESVRVVFHGGVHDGGGGCFGLGDS